LLIENAQKVDEAQLPELLNTKPAEAPEWPSPWPRPGDGCRALRAFGIVLMFAALGFAVGVWRGMQIGLTTTL